MNGPAYLETAAKPEYGVHAASSLDNTKSVRMLHVRPISLALDHTGKGATDSRESPRWIQTDPPSNFLFGSVAELCFLTDVNSKDRGIFIKQAGRVSVYASRRTHKIQLLALVVAAFSFLFTAAAQQQPSVSEMLADVNSLGSGWELKVYLLFDSAAAPAEIVQTSGPPPGSALKNWRHGVQDSEGRISGWVLAHYTLASGTNSPKYEVHLERYRSHDALIADFDKLLETADATLGSPPLKQIGDAAFVAPNSNGAGVKVWFRRENFRVWINPIGAPRHWEQDASLRLLAQVIDQHIAMVTLQMRGEFDGAALLKHAMEEAVSSPHPGAIVPQHFVKVGGAIVPISKSSISNAVTFAFDHWEKEAANGDAPAVFRLTNSGPRSILLWNVRVQNPATAAAVPLSAWETIQDDYPTATSAVCEAGGSIKFWVNKPVQTPWRSCILYSRELSESDRPKDSQRSWGGNFEVIGQPVH